MNRPGSTGFVANTLANLLVGAAALGYAVIVPAVVVRRFGTDPYGTWYLAFQVAAYVVLLDLGSQYVVTKEAAEGRPGGDAARLTTSAMLAQAALAVVVLAVATGWAALTGQPELARLVVVLGVAAISSLLASTVRAWFQGFRQAHVPAVWLVAGRVASLLGLAVGIVTSAGLVSLTVAVALPQLLVHAVFLGWARRPPSPWARPDREALTRLVEATVPLALWTVCSIIIGGVDVFVVRAVEAGEVGRFALALPLLAVPTGAVTAAMTAWMPRVAAVEAATAGGGRAMTATGTTLMAGALALGALAFVAHADLLVRLLAGEHDHGRAATYLQLLYVASALRFVFLPWAMLIMVRGEQGRILLSPVAEAATNLGASVVLGLWIGAVGVALGTLAGSSVALVLHLCRDVRRTPATGVSGRDLLQAAGRAWPPIAAACVPAGLAVAGASTAMRALAFVVALGVDVLWFLDATRSDRIRPRPLASSMKP